MKTSIRYPLRFGAQPITTESRKVVLCSYLHEHEVPQVSAAETRTVLDTTKLYETDSKSSPVVRTIKVIEHDGRLFRKVCDRADFDKHDAFINAFEMPNDRNKPLHPVDVWDMHKLPLGKGLSNRIAHRLYLEGCGKEKEANAWPAIPVRWTARNGCNFEFYFPRKLTDIDEQEFEAGLDEIAKEADRLLLIDDELWLETPPPVYEVGLYTFSQSIFCYDYLDFRSNEKGLRRNFSVQLAFLPDWLDVCLDRQYFPLSAKDDAVEYALRANAWVEQYRDELKCPIRDLTEDIDGLDAQDTILNFDQAAYSTNRAAMLLAGDVSVSLMRKPELAEKLSVTHRNAVSEACATVASMGWNPNDWAANEYAADVVDAWTRTGRKRGWTQLPANRDDFAALACERTLELSDTMPIMAPRAGLERRT